MLEKQLPPQITKSLRRSSQLTSSWWHNIQVTTCIPAYHNARKNNSHDLAQTLRLYKSLFFGTFLWWLDLLYIDDTKDHYICDSYQRAKATRVYIRQPQSRAQQPYQFLHMDLVWPINLLGFEGERYFFTLTDNCTRMTEMYIGTKKSD